MEETNRFKIAKRVTAFINTYFTEKWDVEKLIKILYRDDIMKNGMRVRVIYIGFSTKHISVSSKHSSFKSLSLF